MLSQFKCLGFYIRFVKEGWIEQFKKAETTPYIYSILQVRAGQRSLLAMGAHGFQLY